MKRMALVLVSALMCSVSLSACGGGSAYCDTVKDATKTLNTFGQKRTNAAFTTYAKTLEGIAKVAPTSVKSDWSTLAKATNGVLAAHKEVGLKLEDMSDTKKVAKINPTELPKLNDAYQKFNDTTKERAAVVKNVKAECSITLT